MASLGLELSQEPGNCGTKQERAERVPLRKSTVRCLKAAAIRTPSPCWHSNDGRGAKELAEPGGHCIVGA